MLKVDIKPVDGKKVVVAKNKISAGIAGQIAYQAE
jgi:hypothetical protein